MKSIDKKFPEFPYWNKRTGTLEQGDWNTGTRGRFCSYRHRRNDRTVPDVLGFYPNRDLLPYSIVFPYPFTTVTLNPGQYIYS